MKVHDVALGILQLFDQTTRWFGDTAESRFTEQDMVPRLKDSLHLHWSTPEDAALWLVGDACRWLESVGQIRPASSTLAGTRRWERVCQAPPLPEGQQAQLSTPPARSLYTEFESLATELGFTSVVAVGGEPAYLGIPGLRRDFLVHAEPGDGPLVLTLVIHELGVQAGPPGNGYRLTEPLKVGSDGRLYPPAKHGQPNVLRWPSITVTHRASGLAVRFGHAKAGANPNSANEAIFVATPEGVTLARAWKAALEPLADWAHSAEELPKRYTTLGLAVKQAVPRGMPRQALALERELAKTWRPALTGLEWTVPTKAGKAKAIAEAHYERFFWARPVRR